MRKTGIIFTIALLAMATTASAQVYSSGVISVTAPDNNTTGVNVPIVVAGGPTSISDVNVCISINHTFDADLDIFLRAPGVAAPGRTLSDDNGSSGHNYIKTVFDDSAATAITAGTAPFTGSYRPEQVLSFYNGSDSNGTWNLFVRDDAGGDTGPITYFSLAFNGAVDPNCSLAPPTPPTSTNLGDLPHSLSVTQAWTAPNVQWYKFVSKGVSAGNLQHLKIDTFGNTLTGGSFPNDTELALYSSTGNLLATNDDINFGGGVYQSMLVFGDATGQPVPGSGDLLAGTYYLAASPFNMTPNATGWDATWAAGGTPSGNIVVNFENVPEPGTMCLVGLGIVGLLRRRR